ncbi:TonB-dependent receptor [Altererythrobacter sp. CC-YST694]|uniref:TonB-dependent receptor plug domain-containing protein n=1 Tax=Altererythrobacter sp. CC-YST694 TaxID=2755038 RepID=UPI001D01C29C|nr:TonB-dependent receptor [Altererythrobacter sp. CC-YST694]MCB5425063.1 TonB-dependent receptor [Altererythrobacter sp. CC-YST694]
MDGVIRRNGWWSAAGIALAWALVPQTASAQSDEAGQIEQDQGGGIIVTASRSGEGVRADQLGASVTILDNEALQERQTRIVSDILRDVPGVSVSRLGAVGAQTQVRLRGSEGNHVLVLVDGIEVADPYMGEYDFGTLIADPAARVEVLRGQQSSLYGSDAIGGVIHYITLSGREAAGISLRGEAGSFGTVSGAVRVAGASNDFDYAVSGSLYNTNGYPTARGGSRDIGSTSVGASAKVNWTPGDNFTLRGVLRYSYSDVDTNDSDDDPASPLFGYTKDSPGVHYVNEAVYGLLSAELTALDGRWSNILTGQFADTTRNGYTAAGLDNGDKGRRYKGSFVSSFRFGTDAISHRLTGAVDVEREEFQNTSPSSPWVFTGKRNTDNVGLVGQYELTAGAFSAGASIRHDDNNRFADATTWRVQGSYRLPTGTRVRGAYGTGVKNPGYFELYGYVDGTYIGNPNLKPEESEGWEAGLEQSFAAGKVTLGATYFDSTLKHEIYTTYPAPDYVATPGNRMTDSRQHGVEVFLAARPMPQLRIDASYTWLKAEENGVEEVRRPGDIASFNATWFSKDDRFSTTLTVRYNGRTNDVAYTDPSWVPVTVSLKPFTLVNLSTRYELLEGLSISGRVENLLNEKYEEVFSFATPGTTAYAGISARF